MNDDNRAYAASVERVPHAPKVPDEREDGVLYMHPLYAKAYYEGLKDIEVHGVRFERAVEP